MSKWLTEANGYAFRIVHVENLPAALVHGIFARNAVGSDPHYKNIGNTELINKRGFRPVPVHPFGVLNDYVPFYFTSHSPMALNIKTGYDVPQRQLGGVWTAGSFY